MTIEQCVIGNDNSFSYWLCYKLRHVASMGGNTYPNAFGVYTKKTSSQILLSSSYKKAFGSDYEKAFNSLKNDVVNFLEDIKQENYDNYEKYRRIDRRVRDMLMMIYFYDRFVPVCTKDKIERCLKSVGEHFEEKALMVYKNLALVVWKKDVPELADWSNQMVLDFCLWLSTKNIKTNKEKLNNNTVIEKAKKIEEELSKERDYI